jgi:serine protease inhibitor
LFIINMRNKVIAVSLTVLLLVTACTPIKGRLDSKEYDEYNVELNVDTSVPWPDAPDRIDNAFRASLLDFAWDLFQVSSENEGNILISPASVFLALGMTYNGSDSETRQAMMETLKAADLSLQEFNEACRDYISILRVMGGKTELSVANSIWYRQGFTISHDFLQTNANYFDARFQSLDFGKPAAIGTINKWVQTQTKNTIDRIIDEINPLTYMFLINAVYFKSDWKEPFDAANTRAKDFDSPDGSITVDFMNRTGEMDYFDNKGVQGVILPYDDGRFKFFAVLPEVNTDIRAFIYELDGAAILDYLMSVKRQDIVLSLPKFETRFEDRLNDELSGMGMAIAFDPNRADFSLMLDNPGKAKENLYIGEVRHKTFCRVDELGTEASAVTSVEMRTTGMIAEPETKLIFDRPFIYGIVDEVTGAPLFLGIMENPLEK